MLKERIQEANLGRKLTSEETKRLRKLEGITDKLKRGENMLFISLKIYNIRLAHKQRRYKTKSYDELKAEMEAIEQQMAKAKKNERASLLKKLKRHCKEFDFTAGMLKVSLAEGRKKL